MAITLEVRKKNKRNAYLHFYRCGACSKQELAAALRQSLPTVNQNISELLEEGLLQPAGHYASTGGRKAAILQCTPDARVAVGAEIMEDYVYAALLDLYGNVRKSELLELAYRNEPDYFEAVGQFLGVFSAAAGYPEERMLGLAVSMQGITDAQHEKMVYSRILDNSGVTAQMLSGYIGKPCVILHDSEAAAFAESFHRPELRDSSYIFLNKYMGSASILNGSIYHGNHGRGQLVEHLNLVPNGRVCYCGQQGCAECYCSAHSLEQQAGEPLEAFFAALRAGEQREGGIWGDYLRSLARTIYNVQMVMDVDIIIGGRVRRGMTEDDLAQLRWLLGQISDFDLTDREISLERVTEHTATQGAAFSLVQEFLDRFGQED